MLQAERTGHENRRSCSRAAHGDYVGGTAPDQGEQADAFRQSLSAGRDEMDQIYLLHIQPGCLGPGYKSELLPVLPVPHELFLSVYPSARTGLLRLRPQGGQDCGDIPGAASGEK